ncbi:Threonine dehydrogenase [Modicisalibacter ilicicola DSM 19980]|uniref:Threonine dehydrogenase n=1 Tax=Modicisalibacter ilicicola DSM 19980 TaxID=1121942 RepID=A0A1M4Y0D1_9GAMM|nr:zinc-binding alcohol dehydrogenase [Halomonas ilicicola]SHE99129.1 Threonine dehydrogenase [Halomonas ilicicola DSM 19980]
MPANTAQAFWVLAPGQGALREEALPPAGDTDVRVRTRYSAISRGTERLVFDGRIPASEHVRMRAPFQQGDFPGPVKYGYASVGVVEQGPAHLLDRNVFCLYPHQDRYVVPADAVLPLPEGLPVERAVLAANMETAINGLWDAGPGIGNRIAVIGAGVVGALIAYLCARIPGTEVQLIDIAPQRAELADTLGIPFCTPENAAGENDLVIHASGTPQGLRSGLRLAGQEATLVEMSWFGQQEVSLPLGEAFHARRLTLRSSQVGTVAPGHRARWDHRRRLALALDLLRDERLDALIDGESNFQDLPVSMPRVLSGSADVLCHRVRY